MGNISPNDKILAQCIGSHDAPALEYFEVCRAHIHQLADGKFAPEQFEARQTWIDQATEYLTSLYRLSDEFLLDPCKAVNYFVVRTVLAPPSTIQ